MYDTAVDARQPFNLADGQSFCFQFLQGRIPARTIQILNPGSALQMQFIPDDHLSFGVRDTPSVHNFKVLHAVRIIQQALMSDHVFQ